MDPKPHHSINRDDMWLAHAACRGVDVDVFYQPAGTQGSSTTWTPAAAKACCAGCPVIVECLTRSVRRNELHGIWGGIGHETRRWLRRKLTQRTHSTPIPDPNCPCPWCRSVTDTITAVKAAGAHHNATTRDEHRIRPVRLADKNGPGATHGRASTYARGCRCGECKHAIHTLQTRNNQKRKGLTA